MANRYITSIPAATLPLVNDTIALPKGFPPNTTVSRDTRTSWSSSRQLDLLGAILFRGFSIMFGRHCRAQTRCGPGPLLRQSVLYFPGVFATLSIFRERFISQHWKDPLPVPTWAIYHSEMPRNIHAPISCKPLSTPHSDSDATKPS